MRGESEEAEKDPKKKGYNEDIDDYKMRSYTVTGNVILWED